MNNLGKYLEGLHELKKKDNSEVEKKIMDILEKHSNWFGQAEEDVIPEAKWSAVTKDIIKLF